MAAVPYLQLYVADYLGDTQHLTTVEHGAYMLLIMAYWQSAKALPSLSKRLAMIARMQESDFEEIKETLSEFFIESDGKWHHKRIEVDLAKIQEKSNKMSANAKRGVEQRLSKSRATAQQKQSHTDTDTDTDNKKLKKKKVIDPEVKKNIDEVYGHWRDVMNSSAKNDAATSEMIKKSLKVYDVGKLKQAIDGCSKKQWNMNNGVNLPKHIFKDSRVTESFIKFNGSQREEVSKAQSIYNNIVSDDESDTEFLRKFEENQKKELGYDQKRLG